MKLRIRGDSIRLRLSQAEVKQIFSGEAVVETTHFLNQTQLQYILEPSEILATPEAVMMDQRLIVRVPQSIIKGWAGSDEVAIKYDQPTPGAADSQLFILIEKDFQCLKTRENENEDESDLFVNPNAAKGHC